MPKDTHKALLRTLLRKLEVLDAKYKRICTRYEVQRRAQESQMRELIALIRPLQESVRVLDPNADLQPYSDQFVLPGAPPAPALKPGEWGF